MTLACIEGFDHMSSTTLMASKNWTWQANSFGIAVWNPTFQAGRVIGKSFAINSPATNVLFGRMLKTLGAYYDHFVCGFGFKSTQMPDLGANAPIFSFFTDPGTMVVRVFVSQTGRIMLLDSGGSVLAQSGPGVFTSNTWHFIEVKVVINGASSSVQLNLNGVTVISSTGCNLGTTPISGLGPYSESNNGWSSAANAGQGVTCYYDDLYLVNTSAPPNNDFLGDCHVETVFPKGAGAHTQWTPDSGSNWQRVNEKAGLYPDDDASYVYSATVGQIDTYDMDDLAVITGTVLGLQPNVYARKFDANLRQLNTVVRSGTTDNLSGVHTLAVGYLDSTDIYDVNPVTGSAWTIASVNAAEFGMKLAA